MQNLDEMRLLLKISKGLGQNLYPELENSIKKEEELSTLILKEERPVLPPPEEPKVFHMEHFPDPTVEELQPIVEEKPIAPEPIDLVQHTVGLLSASVPLYKDTPATIQTIPPPPTQDLDIVKKSVAELTKKMATLSWGGGGSGEVNFKKLDDIDKGSIGNTDQILRFNPQTGFFFFGQLSGDQGPVRSLKFDTNGAGVTPTPGTVTWNQTEDCLDVHQSDGTSLQTGLEQYIRVTNISGNTMNRGLMVAFSGVNGNQTPICTPYVANSSAIPLYTIGIIAEPIANNSSGRATVFGKVANINTTGSDVGETWQIGDILWAHPTIAGKLTNDEPTAPNPSTSIAAVLKVGTSDGVILVRPSIFPRLWFANFTDSTNQTAAAANTAYAVKFNTTEIASGHRIDTLDTSKVIAEKHGLYNYQFSIQFTSTNSSKSKVWIWARKNGIDIPDTASRLSVDGNGTDFVPSWNFQISMQPNDFFQLMWATDSTNVGLVAAPATAFCPSIPSVILTVAQINI